MTAFPQLLGSSYTLFSSKAEIQHSYNLYRQRIQTGEGINSTVMLKSPGLNPNADLGSRFLGQGRGFYELNDHLFAVLGDRVYDYTSAFALANYGPISNADPICQMAASPTSLMIVVDGHMYRINGGVLTEIFPPFTPRGIAFGKNYFVSLADNTSAQIYFSSNDGLTWPAANVQTAEADANKLLTVKFINQQFVTFGNRVTQWFAVGTNPNAPLVPIDSGVIQSGALAGDTVVTLGHSLLWLERFKQGQFRVMMSNGYSATPVSNGYVENKIRSMAAASTVDDAIGMAFMMNGQEFYRITFPTADWTLEYNRTLNEWEDVLWWNWLNGTYHRHRSNCIVSAFNTLFASDHANGSIYELTPDCYHDYGFPLRFERVTPHIVEGDKRIGIDRLDLGVQTGVGLTTPLWLNDYSLDAVTFAADLATQVAAGNVTVQQALILQFIYDNLPHGTAVALPDSTIMGPLGFYQWGGDPKVTLEVSANGGVSYGNPRDRRLGGPGDDLQVAWNCLGSGRDRVLKLYGDDPVKIAFTGAWLEAEAFLS